MKRPFGAILAVWLVTGVLRAQEAPGPGPRAISLSEAFALALKRSEELARRGETVVQLDAKVSELWSAVKPRIGLLGTELVQDVPPRAAGISSTFTQRTREQAQLTLHQPLFAGLREYLAIRAARLQTRSAELALKRSEHLLYQDAARAYLDLLGVRREIAIREALASIMDDRIRDLRRREGLGRTRKSEVLAAESQRAQIEAELATARGRERIAQAEMRFLTGLEEDLGPRELGLPEEEPLEGLLDRAARRPDIEAARQEREVSSYRVGMARRQRWPTLNLDGNYYLRRPPGFQDQVKWDVLFSLQLPLYAGGSVGAQIREAEASRRSQDQALSLALRRSELEVRAAHQELSSALAIVKALEKAALLAQANAEAQSEDYRLGVVTNLDVLGSLNALQETRLRLNFARLEAYGSKVRLEVAAGAPGGLP